MASRPIGCIYPDCLNCPLSECEYDALEIDDEIESKDMDSEILALRIVAKHHADGTYSQYASQIKYNRSAKGRMKQNKYNHSAKGILTRQRYEQSDKGKEAKRRYSRSLRGQEAQKTYFLSEKGIEARNRYLNSEKGKEALKRKAQKDVASGKNAERCKRYYEKHKAEILAKAKEKRKKVI